MPSPYLPTLIQLAQDELPLLAHDVNNASTLFTLQKTVQRLQNVVTYLLHHVILEDPSLAAATRNLQAAPAAPAHQHYAPASVGHPPAQNYYPHLNAGIPAPIAQPNVGGLPMIGVPAQVAHSNVAEVIMTRDGTRVIPPGRSEPAHVLPPGTPVDATFGDGAQVVLPQGGGMTPEVAEALARAAAGTAGARNITTETPAP